MVNNTDIKSIDDKNTVTYHKEGQEFEISSDMVVLSTGQKSVESGMENALDEAGIEYIVIGDGNKPGKFIGATTDGFFAALNL